MRKRFALTVCAVLSCVARLAAEPAQAPKMFPAAGLKMIQVKTDTADVDIRGADRRNVQVQVNKMDPKKCAVVMEARGDSLVLEVRRLSNAPCFSSPRLAAGVQNIRSEGVMRGNEALPLILEGLPEVDYT